MKHWTPFNDFEGEVVFVETANWQYVGKVENIEHDALAVAWVELSGTLQLFGESSTGPDEKEARTIGRHRIPSTSVQGVQLAADRWPEWKP